MKLIIIFGPQAVGKMTVGYELEKHTGIPLFHNHMTIDLVSPFFGYGTPTGRKLVQEFRFRMFEEVAKGDGLGMIFTFVWAFNDPSDREYIKKIVGIFEENRAEIYFVELETTLEERIKRNTHEFRLSKKPSKRDTKRSLENLLEYAERDRLNSLPGEITYKNYIKINNTEISAEDCAKMICENFGWN